MKGKTRNCFWLCLVLGGCVITGTAIGTGWYHLWWNYPFVPTPPVTRYLLPDAWAGYDDIRMEMILWSITFCSAISFLIFRHMQKTQNQSLEPTTIRAYGASGRSSAFCSALKSRLPPSAIFATFPV